MKYCYILLCLLVNKVHCITFPEVPFSGKEVKIGETITLKKDLTNIYILLNLSDNSFVKLLNDEININIFVWGAFFSGKKELKLNCYETSDSSVMLVPCNLVLKMYNVVYKSDKNNFTWLGDAKSLANLQTILKQKEIEVILRNNIENEKK